MYGDLANKLIFEAKRTQQLIYGNDNPQLPMYQDSLVRNILKEISQLKRNADFLKDQETIQQLDDKVTKCQYFVALLCMEKNKRCLLAYEKMRSEILDSLVWGSNGMEYTNGYIQVGQENNNLSHQEQVYLKEYAQLLTDMKCGDFIDIDLSGSLIPPSDVFIDVRVIKDAGEIQTEYGVFNLIKDSQFFVRQTDVERLIQQGYLQKL